MSKYFRLSKVALCKWRFHWSPKSWLIATILDADADTVQLICFISDSLKAQIIPHGQHYTGQSFNITCRITSNVLKKSIKIDFYKWVNNAFIKVPDQSVVRTTSPRAVNVSIQFKQALAMPPTTYKCIARAPRYTKDSEAITSVTVRGMDLNKILFILNLITLVDYLVS